MEEEKKSRKNYVKYAHEGKKRQQREIHERIFAAIKGSGGIVSRIAEAAGCSRETVYKHMKEDKALAEAYNDECEMILDVCVEGLQSLVYAQNLDAIRYYLDFKGASRGFGSRSGMNLNNNTDTQQGGVKIVLFEKDFFPEGYPDAKKDNAFVSAS